MQKGDAISVYEKLEITRTYDNTYIDILAHTCAIILQGESKYHPRCISRGCLMGTISMHGKTFACRNAYHADRGIYCTSSNL